MEWKNARRSSNVEDRRGGMGTGAKIGGIGGVIVVLLGLFMGADLQTMLNLVGGGEAQIGGGSVNPPNDTAEVIEAKEFISAMIAANEDIWASQARKYGFSFSPAKMVIFSDRVNTACGAQSAGVGPFYCSGDRSIYLYINFINDMQRLGASRNRQIAGNFAMAYVLAHEYGHHISHLSGVMSQAHQAMANARTKADKNAISVKLELQADCFAGVWAGNLDFNKYKIRISMNDLQAGIETAHAIGDDALSGSNNRENFTHGSSQERANWLQYGFNNKNMAACNTFGR